MPAKHDAGVGVAGPPAYPPLDRTSPQLTVRAVLTGMVLGGTLSLCNVYAGLLIGWGFNMSVTAALLSYGFWQTLHVAVKTPKWGMLENNINQTAASSGANISSAGLVAPIPALTILTGYEFTWGVLVVWTFVVALVGITVAIGLRRQMLIVDQLPFPSGIATAETVKEMYAHGAEAMARVKMLVGGGAVATASKLTVSLLEIPKIALPGKLAAGGVLSAAGRDSITLKNLTFALDPSLLMIAVGAISGVRAGASMLLGAFIGWGILAPWALAEGWAMPGADDPGANWFGPVLKWLLWPGVAMMVTASLTSFAFSWRSVVNAIRGTAAAGDAPSGQDADEVPRRWFIGAIAAVLVLAVLAQSIFFNISWWTAAFGVALTFMLAIVAARVAGETNITPVGAMGKVTQLTFGIITPGNATANLMAANVTGGAASQCADLLHDMKTGLLIGASPRQQTISQVFGALSGALAGTAAYLLIVQGDPKKHLLTEEFPAPAVAAWKAVAEIFMRGIEAMPEKAMAAMIIAGVVGVALAVLEKVLPRKYSMWTPSPSSMGLALVIPAYYAIAMFAGGVLAMVTKRVVPNWTVRFMIVLAAGIIAGESITGVGMAIQKILATAR